MHKFLLVLYCLLCLTPSWSQIYVDSSATGNNDGSSWSDAYQYLQDALDASAVNDSIFISKGTYYPDEADFATVVDDDRNSTFLVANTRKLFGGFDVTGGDTTLALRDWKNNLTILSGDINQTGTGTGNSRHVISATNAGANTLIDGLIIERGFASGAGANSMRRGGGLIGNNCDVRIRNSIFRYNEAEILKASGGAIFVNNGSDPVVENCLFYGNRCSRGGGAIGLGNNCTLLTINTVFRGNRSTQNQGGSAIFSSEVSSVQIINSTISGNSGPGTGSAIKLKTGSSLTIENTIVWNNANPPSILVNTPASYVVRHSIIEDSGGSNNWMLTNATDGGGNKDENPRFIMGINPATAPNDAGNLRLKLISPAIDMGDNGLYTSAGGPLFDLDNRDRIALNRIDMGAYEYNCPPPASVYYVDSAATGANTGLTWNDAFTSLQDALTIPCGYDTVFVSKGTYYPDESDVELTNTNDRTASFTIISGAYVFGGFNTSAGDTTLATRDWKKNVTVLSGDIDQDTDFSGNSYHVVVASGGQKVLDGFTITGGSADGSSVADQRGGGLFCNNANPVLQNLKVMGNQAQDIGGGMFFSNGSAPVIYNTVVADNESNNGGGVTGRNADMLFVNTVFRGNYSATTGGALQVEFNSDADIINSSFSGNRSSAAGGAVYQDGGTVSVKNSILWNNSANGSTTGTGASYFLNSGSAGIANSIVENSGGGTVWVGGSNFPSDAGNNKDSDPMFIANVDPGTAPTSAGELALQDASPAKDMGDNLLYPGNAPGIDLGCNTRIRGTIIDMGAYEAFSCNGITNLYVDSTAAPGGDGMSWGTAFKDLQDALQFPCAIDSILVSKGTYFPDRGTNNNDSAFFIPNGVVLLGGFDTQGGQTTITSRNWKSNHTILSGDLNKDGNPGGNSLHVLRAVNTNANTVLDGFIVERGSAIQPIGPNRNRRGGGLLANNSTLGIRNSIFRYNRTDAFNANGGAIFANGSQLLIENCEFYANQSPVGGGAVGLAGNSELSAVNTIFRGNATNQNDAGSAIYGSDGSTVKLINTTITGNGRSGPGTGNAIKLGAGSSLTIDNSIVWNNQQPPSIDIATPTTYLVRNSIIEGSGGSGNWMLTGATDGGGNKDVNPEFIQDTDPFAAPSDVGDLRLLFISPAIDMGDSTLYPGSAPGIDLACDDRIQGTEINMGAYEASDNCPSSLTLYVDSAATGQGTGFSWTDAFTKLQDALNIACPVDTILVSKGTYYPDEFGNGTIDTDDRDTSFVIPDSVILLGGFNTSIGITAVADRDWINNETILSGDIDQSGDFNGNSANVVEVPDSVTYAKIDGFTIRDGSATGAGTRMGGAGLIDGGSVRIENSRIFNNRSGDRGGAIFASEGSRLWVANSSFVANESYETGGALDYINTNVILVNTLFKGNRASRGGGAVAARGMSETVIINSTFSGNRGTSNVSQAGAILSSGMSNLNIVNSIIWNNSQRNDPNVVEASITASPASTTTITNSIVDNSGGSTMWNVPNVNDGSGNKDVDPLFVVPASWMGLPPNNQGDLRLKPVSPAIDMGESTLYPGTAPDYDLGWSDRIQLSEIDMGAYEFTCGPLNAGYVLYVDSAATGAHTGLNWTDAFTHLQDALQFLCPVDSIFVSRGTYYPDEFQGGLIDSNDRAISFELPDSMVILGGFSTAAGDTLLSIRDWKSYPTILSGDINQNGAPGGNSYQVVYTEGVSEATVLDGFTITGGNANGTGLVDDVGGGIYNRDTSAPVLRNLVITANRANVGGGIGNDFGSSPTLYNVKINGNTAVQNGGGLFNNGSSPLLVNVLLSGNRASRGGGIFNNESSPSLVNTTISGNNATNTGGGLANQQSSSVTISNSIIWNNQSNNDTETIAASISNSSGSGTILSYNIIDNSGGSNSWMMPASNNDGGNNKDLNPQFTTDIDPNSAPNESGDFRLMTSSPAINMGDTTLYADTFPSIDLACAPRIQQGEIDMGAYEGFCSVGVLYVDSTATGSNSGLSWQDAFTSLQDALTSGCEFDSIFVSKGTYYPDESAGGSLDTDNRGTSFVIPDSVVILGGFSTATGDTLLSTRDWKSNPTILSGDIDQIANVNDNSVHVVEVPASTTYAEINGFTITEGYASPTEAGVQMGGGVILSGGNLRLVNSHILGNESAGSGRGGGLFAGDGSRLWVANTAFVLNKTSSTGGAMEYINADVTLVNTMFLGNTALIGGGAITSRQMSHTSMVNCTVSGNRSTSGSAIGGAIRNSNEGEMSIVNSIIWNNRHISSTDGIEASIFASVTSTTSITNSIVDNSGGSSLWSVPNVTDGGNNKDVDPLFLQPAVATGLPNDDGDLRLQPSSPAINMGDATYYADTFPSIDLACALRIQQGEIDMGAYEVPCIDDTLICRDITIPLDTNGIAVLSPEQLMVPKTFDTIFNSTGELQSLTIPAGVTSVYIEAAGGKGGRADFGSGYDGGNGALAGGIIEVTPGEVLEFIVAGAGGNSNLAGGGGGATFVTRGSTGFADFQPGNLLLIAGGGGGARVGHLGQSSNHLQASADGPGGLGGSTTLGIEGGGASATHNGGGVNGGIAAINGATGGGNGGFGGGGGRRDSDAGGGGGATGGNATRGNESGRAGTSFVASDHPVFIPAINNDKGFVRIIYNYALLQAIVTADTFHCTDIGNNQIEVIYAKCEGNVDTCYAEVKIIDNILPVVIAPADTFVDCSQTDVSFTGMATADAVDVCGLDTIQYRDEHIDHVCSDTILRIWTAVDPSGNVSEPDTQRIVLTDTISPLIFCPPNDTIQCGTPVINTQTIHSPNGGIIPTLSTKTFNLEGFDSLNAISFLSFELNIETNSPEGLIATLVSPQGTSVQIFKLPNSSCNKQNIVATFTDTASMTSTQFRNECNAIPPAKGPGFYQPVQPFSAFTGESPGGQWQLKITNNGSDENLKLVSWSLTISFTPFAVTVDGCNKATITAVHDDSTALSDCGTGDLLRTFVATDGCGNSDSCVQIITIVDTIGPSPVMCPGDSIAFCGDDLDTINFGQPDYVDNSDCRDELSITYRDQYLEFDKCHNDTTGVLLRTFFASDCSGNVDSSCQQRITVVDTSGPQVLCPGPLFIHCDSILEDPILFQTSQNREPEKVFGGFPSQTIARDTITVSGAPIGATVQNLLIDLDVASEFASLVKASIISPAGTVVDLINIPMQPCINPDIHVRFYDQAPQTNDDYQAQCNATTPAREGDFRPKEPFGILAGESINGNWIVQVENIIPHLEKGTLRSWGLSVSSGPIVIDACSDVVSSSFSDDTIPGYCEGEQEILRTFLFTDACDNTASCTQRIRFFTPLPSLVCPPDTVINSDTDNDTAVLGSATVTPTCAGEPSITFVDTTFDGRLGSSIGFALVTQGDRLIRIDVESGTSSLVDTIDMDITQSFVGGEFVDGDYIFSQHDSLFMVDTGTAAVTTLMPTVGVLTGLSADRTSGILYAIHEENDTSSLYQIDLDLGTMTLIGQNTIITDPGFLAIDPVGNAYVLDLRTDALCRIDLSTADIIAAGVPITDGMNSLDAVRIATEMEFVLTRSGTMLYGNITTRDDSGLSRVYGLLDPMTGLFTSLSSLNTSWGAFASPGFVSMDTCTVVQTIIRTFMAEDECGGRNFCTQLIEVQDTTTNRVVYVDSIAFGDENGTTWEHAFTDLQDALTMAEACPGTIDTILVAEGTYYPTPDSLDRDSSFNIPDGVVVMGGFPSGGGTLDNRDWICHKTILSGDINNDGTLSGNSYHVVHTNNVSSATVVDGFTITMGSADGSSKPYYYGGGWYNDGSGSGNSSNPTILNCVFSGNSAELSGGAIYNNGFQGESSPELTHCVLSGNSAELSGGAIYNNGFQGESSPEMTHCVLSGNSAYGGGAINNNGRNGTSSPVLTNCVLSGNSAGLSGGAVYNFALTGTSSPELTNCVLSGNSAESDGGAIYNFIANGSIGSPVLTNCIFYQNEAGNSGPVFYNGAASPSISYSMFDVDYVDLNTGCTNCVDTTDGGNKFSTDPQFVFAPIASSAPTTGGDFHLKAGSPAIDMGDNGANMEAEDIDGLSRIYNGTIDMGAYEWRPYCLQDTVYLNENGEGMVHLDSLMGELPESQGCELDTIIEAPIPTCSDTAVLYTLYLIRGRSSVNPDTIIQCTDTIWVIDTLPPVFDMINIELAVNEDCMPVMPDLSSYVSDNCALDTVIQSPEVGDPLGPPGSMVMVKLYARDSSRNADSVMFDFEVVTEPTVPPNCAGIISPAINPDGTIEVLVNEIAPNANCLAVHDVQVLNEWDGVIWRAEDLRNNDFILDGFNLCSYLGKTLNVEITNGLGTCTTVLNLNKTGNLVMTSDLQSGIDPAISEGKINVYCGKVPDPSKYKPTAVDMCTGTVYTPRVQPDWVMPFACSEGGDTAEVIFRTWEAYDKEGNLSTLTDTIIVFRLPRLTPDAFIATAEDSFYCELEAVPNDGSASGGQGLKRYSSWKQPVGLHDYEQPYTKLRGVTYEIPATIIIAGLINADNQGLLDEYLKCVILRKDDGTEVTIGDMVSGDYFTDLVAGASQEQLGYGFLHAINELNEDPIGVLLFRFYPYLLLQPGDWVLSEGGNFEQVDEAWFYSGNGNAPYWFSGGWPSIYGGGDCVSYCDTGAGAPGGPRGGCVRVQVPQLNAGTGFDPELCDTICLPPSGHEINLPTGTHCGITIRQDPGTWQAPGLYSPVWACHKIRGMDTWITQTCWAETPNHCADDGEEPCVELSADLDQEDAVVDYSCTEKAVKVHLSQWQTLIDTIGPVFDFCYPSDWDQAEIQESIRNGDQYGAAKEWEGDNPTRYRVSSHECEAEVYVPDVKVIDNCSGVQQVKAMMEVKGGIRAVALERTATEMKILDNGDTCYTYTYSHTSDPIRVPFDGCYGEPTQVRYEAADNCWNQSTWNKYIKIVDDVPPTVVADREVTVPLQNKIAWVHAETFDEGSWDNCAIDLRVVRRSDWLRRTAVRLCSNAAAGPNAPYDNWVDLLDDLGVDGDQVEMAVNGTTVGEAAFNSKYNVDDLATVLNDGEVEEYYFHQIQWLWEDSELCGKKVVHGWLYSIAAYIAEHCSTTDEHGNVLQVKDLENIFDYLTGKPGYGKEMALLGGGWSRDVPFKCKDACLPDEASAKLDGVTVELAVFDYCCNWGKGWATAHVEDKGNARLVKRLPDLDLTCEAYNTFYKDIVENAAALGENGSEQDTSGAFAALDAALGHYVKTWVDNQNRPTDIDGNLLPDSVLNFDYHSITCAEKSETEKIAVERHDGTIDWVTKVHKTTYLDTAELTGMNGIIGINCAASCIKDVWVNLDECGQGTITRRFTIRGGCGPTLRHAQGPTEQVVEQVINVESACGMRESMFDLPENLGTKEAPVCLPQALSDDYLPDTIGAVTLKQHLKGALCNSIAIGSKVKSLDVLDSDMTKYEITWTVIDWCAPHTSTNREFTYTQEVIATIDPDCDVSVDTTGDVSIITGEIMTELNSAVKGVNVKAIISGRDGRPSVSTGPLNVETPGSGEFSFSIANGSQVSIVPGKNTGFSNGVSTADLIDMQRHILQKDALNSKYKRIAADVNGNGRIDGLDVLELRQLVLNPSGTFANNTSWRFYETETDKEMYEIDPLTDNQTVNFTAVKIGDVNLSGDPARSSRSKKGSVNLNIVDNVLKGGEVYRVEVRSDNFGDIRGMQYTLGYADAYVSVELIESGVLNVTPVNYLKYGQAGQLTFSWSEAAGVSAGADEVLFTIVLKAKSAVALRDALALNNRVTPTEAYDGAGEIKDLSLRFDGSRLKDGTDFALYQNTPNPFEGETVIGFKLPKATSATMTIYDVTGGVIKTIQGDYREGYNEVRVRSEELGTTGVLYYQLDTDRYTATKKMIVVE